MPQETNLNVAPYFDDFDPNKNYYKVLFKPGYPVQARELTTLQTILQDQIAKFGNHIFKEGDSVTGGGVRYVNNFPSVLIETSYSGISVSGYIRDLLDKVVVGSVSGVRAKVKAYLNLSAFPGQSYTLYVNYLDSSNDNQKFLDGENLLISVYVWMSYKEISHVFKFGVDVLYDPDSKAKSYTLATPISFPADVVEVTPSLWSLRLTVYVVEIPIIGDPLTLFKE